MTQYIFRAQSLDNISTDPIEVDGSVLDARAIKSREEATTRIAVVKLNGSEHYAHDGVRLTENGTALVIEAPSVELDAIGRRAPIVCYCTFDAANLDPIIASAVQNFERFARRIGRSLSPEHKHAIQQALVALKKKLAKRRLYRFVLSIAASLLLFVVAYQLLFPS